CPPDSLPSGPITLHTRLKMNGVDEERALLAGDARVDHPDELVVVQDRHREVAVLAFRRRDVDLDAVAHAEQSLCPSTVADQRVEGRQEGGAALPIPLECRASLCIHREHVPDAFQTAVPRHYPDGHELTGARQRLDSLE